MSRARRRCACERRCDRLRGRHRHGQHLRQVRLGEPGRAPPDGGFERTLDELLAQARPQSLLDVGCGEGVLVHRWALSMPQARLVGIDLEEESIQAGWAEREAPNLEYRTMRAEDLPFADGRVRSGQRDRGARARPRPRAHARRDGALRRAPPARVGPARAAVADAEHGSRRLLGQLGNTPGHLNHWSKRSFTSCSRATARSSRPARRSPGRCCLSGLDGLQAL